MRSFISKAKTLAKSVFSHAKKQSADHISTFFRSSKVAKTQKNLKDHWMTIAGFGSIDVGVFQANHIAGWIVLGVLILLLEVKVERLG